MFASFCEFYHWTLHYSLSIPAITFFALLRKAEQIMRRRNANKMIDLCHVSAVANSDRRYFDQVVAHFSARLDDTLPERPKVTGLRPDDPFVMETMRRHFDTYRRLTPNG